MTLLSRPAYYLVSLVVFVALLDHGDCHYKDQRQDRGDWVDWCLDRQLENGDDQEVEVGHTAKLLEQIPVGKSVLKVIFYAFFLLR